MGVGNDLSSRSFHDSPIGAALLDSAGRFLDVNVALTRILGRHKDDLIGRAHGEFTHQDDLPRDVEMDERLLAGLEGHYQSDRRLLHRSGDTVWARVTVSAMPAAEDPRGKRLLVYIEDITEVRRARDLLERKALYDGLTGLANRTLLMERLEHALDGRAINVACIFIDIDHFKAVNDSLGHDIGDEFLREVAHRIQGAVRSADTVARLGGDEFLVVAENVGGLDAAVATARGIAAAVSQPIVLAGHELLPSLSVGLAMAEPGLHAESLVRNADMAMYTAKDLGRARVEVYSESMRASARNRLSIESELRAAIRDGELVVYYQPVVDLETRAIAAYEALVRWQHPTRGLLMPDQFIPISEDANLVVPLGAAVVMDACRFLAARPRFDGKVFVNVSTRQIGAADLTRVVREALEATGAAPHQLCLEITESGVLMATAAARSDLRAITELGVELILDDFGTGYSALSSVLQNPVSGLKLARDFTLRLGDRGTGDRISTAMATLTRSLGMFGVIEGIETEAQYALAKAHGWQLGQGFLFGHATHPCDITHGLPDSEVQAAAAPMTQLPAATHGTRSSWNQ